MSVSGGRELETVIATTGNVAPGDTGTVQIDAEEDRRIHGAELDFEGLDTAQDFDGRARAYVGTDPDPGLDNAEDIGGKFYVDSEITVDGTNGFAVVSKGEFPLEAEPSFDWNEDVTLTLKMISGGASSEDVRATLTLYYTEV